MTTRHQVVQTLSRPAHALKRCFRCFLLIFLLLLAGGLYVNRIGLPDAVKDRVVRELAARGVRVEVARVRWEILEGIVMDDLLYYAGALDPEPLARAEEVSVNLQPAAWLRGRNGVRGFTIRNARLGMDGGISGIYASVRLEDQGLRLQDLSADYNGLKITGGGYIARPQANMNGVLVQAWRKIFPPSEAEKSFRAGDFLEELKAVRFAEGSSAQIMLVLHPDDLNANEFTVEARGRGLTARGVNIAGWRMQASLAEGRFTLARLSVASGEQALRVSGFLDLTDGTAACRLFSDLPPYVLLAMGPDPLRQMLDASGVLVGEAFEFSADAGPAPVGELLNVFHGSLALKEARIGGVPVVSAALEFSRDHRMLSVTNLQAAVGQKSRSGPLTGYFSCDLESKTYSGQMATGFDPGWMCPLVSTGKARVISGLYFRESFPQTAFTFSGRRGEDGTPLHVEGSVRGKNLSFRGTYLTSIESKLVMTNGVLVLDPLTARRGRTACRGRVTFDFLNDVVDVDVKSTFDPKATLRIMGPTLERLSRPFSFDGYSHITARGSIDYATLTNMNLEAHIVTSNMTYRHVAAESCSFDLLAQGRRFEIRNLQGLLYGGRMEMSRAVIESLVDSPLWHYELAFSLAGTDFGKLMQAYRRMGENHPYEGKLNFMLAVAGETGDQLLLRMRGRGNVHISESRLLRIPLFGGLSKILSALYPNFGIVSQNDLAADFKIGGNTIRTQNVRLLGHIISVHGSGRYHFTNNLDFKVRVRMLREGRLAALLDWLTFPVTKLLEFHLGGPMEQPVWRPDNLPKELFNMLKSVIPGVGDETKR